MLGLLITLLACASFNMAHEMSRFNDFSKMSFQDIVSLFNTFVQNYDRNYKDASETIMRLEVFSESLRKIIDMNNQAGKAVFGITELADYTQEELDAMLPAYKESDRKTNNVCQKNVVNAPPDNQLPQEVDWRKQGAVTEVENQQGCGSCWAFATIGAVEGAYAVKTRRLVPLSKQQLVDCNSDNNGCRGGWPDLALLYIMNNGVATEQDYPYVSHGQDDVFPCRADSVTPAVRVTGCVSHQIQSEDGLMKVLAEKGPLSLIISFGEELVHYKEGVLENCPANEVNHAVVLVGYGTDERGVPYWLIKNSHGRGWGEGGYFRVKRNVNACNMVAYAANEALV